MGVHFVLQGKGGVGKSLIAMLIANYIADKGLPLMARDTDPFNPTFSAYKRFKGKTVQFMNGHAVDPEKFDQLMEEILSTSEEVVIDNGSTSFLPLTQYMVENEAFEVLLDSGKDVFVHVPVMAGAVLVETLAGLVQLSERLPNGIKIVPWLNEYEGSIAANGKTFEQMPEYVRVKAKIAAIVTLKQRTRETFGADLMLAVTQRLSLSEAIERDIFKTMAKSRLSQIKRDVAVQLDAVMGVPSKPAESGVSASKPDAEANMRAAVG